MAAGGRGWSLAVAEGGAGSACAAGNVPPGSTEAHLAGRHGPPGPVLTVASHGPRTEAAQHAPPPGAEEPSAGGAKKSPRLPGKACGHADPNLQVFQRHEPLRQQDRTPLSTHRHTGLEPLSRQLCTSPPRAPTPPAGQDVWLSLTDFTSRRSPLGTGGRSAEGFDFGSGPGASHRLWRSCRSLWLRRTRLAVSMTTSEFRLSAAMARSPSSSSPASQASLVLLSNSWKVLTLLAFTGVVGALGAALSKLQSKGKLVLSGAGEDLPPTAGKGAPG